MQIKSYFNSVCDTSLEKLKESNIQKKISLCPFAYNYSHPKLNSDQKKEGRGVYTATELCQINREHYRHLCNEAETGSCFIEFASSSIDFFWLKPCNVCSTEQENSVR